MSNDMREAFEAAMRKLHPEWTFTADPVFGYHNERTRCAWEGFQAACQDREMLVERGDKALAALLAFKEGGPPGGGDFNQWHESYRPAIELAEAAISFDAAMKGQP